MHSPAPFLLLVMALPVLVLVFSLLPISCTASALLPSGLLESHGLLRARLPSPMRSHRVKSMDDPARARLHRGTRILRRHRPPPAAATDVHNSIGIGFDPAPLTVTLNGTKTYLFPDVDFGYHAYLRVSSTLDDLYRDTSKKIAIYKYNSSVGTEAADIARWDHGFLYTVSAISDDTMRALTSVGPDPLGNWTDRGRMKDGNGNALIGYDPHVILHPNGKRYLTYSDHVSVLITEFAGNDPTQTKGEPVPLVSYGINTEAPCSVIFDNRNGSNMINLAFATGNYYQSNYDTRIMYIDASLDPLTPSNWVQQAVPVLSSDSSVGVYGPGSGGFFEGPDGQTWFAYGAFNESEGASDGKNERTVRLQAVKPDDCGVFVPTRPIAAPNQY